MARRILIFKRAAEQVETSTSSSHPRPRPNVWVDCIDESSPWHDRALEQLHACSERAPLHVNIVVYYELLIPGPDVGALDALLDVYDTLRTPLP